jgi:hypothetical protein
VEWSRWRKDAAQLLQDLEESAATTSDSAGLEAEDKGQGETLPSAGELEYKHFLKRWLLAHQSYNSLQGEEGGSGGVETEHTLLESIKQKNGSVPPQTQPARDPNLGPFPIPSEAQNELRPYLRHADWTPMVTSLGQGESAWPLLPADVIKNGLTTPQQQTALAQRARRHKLNDPQRMQKRREILARYFVKRYRMPRARVEAFLQWNDVMARGQAEFAHLCRSS